MIKNKLEYMSKTKVEHKHKQRRDCSYVSQKTTNHDRTGTLQKGTNWIELKNEFRT